MITLHYMPMDGPINNLNTESDYPTFAKLSISRICDSIKSFCSDKISYNIFETVLLRGFHKPQNQQIYNLGILP